MEDRTTGQAFTAPDGTCYRPSMFITWTLPSYGKVIPGTGIPADPARYDYRRAALDALHFPKLVDRLWQNLRRCAGFKVQYFSAVEAQRRLAPHLHAAIRGAIPRKTIRQVTKATYFQLWWPAFDEIRYDGDRLPVWDREAGGYCDPDTGRPLRTFRDALDELDDDPDATPAHVVRFGQQTDVKGLLAGSKDSERGRLPVQVPDQVRRRHLRRPSHLRPHRRPAHRIRGAHRPPPRAGAMAALLTGVRELAALRNPTRRRRPRTDPRHVPGPAPRPREPGHRRATRPGVPAVVRQDPHRAPRRPGRRRAASPRGRRYRRPRGGPVRRRRPR